MTISDFRTGGRGSLAPLSTSCQGAKWIPHWWYLDRRNWRDRIQTRVNSRKWLGMQGGISQ